VLCLFRKPCFLARFLFFGCQVLFGIFSPFLCLNVFYHPRFRFSTSVEEPDDSAGTRPLAPHYFFHFWGICGLTNCGKLAKIFTLAVPSPFVGPPVTNLVFPCLLTAMTTAQLWKTVLSDLEVSLSHGNFMTWMAPTHLVRVQQVDVGRQIVEIACSSAYHKQFIEERYVGQIKEALDRITKQNNELVLTVASFTAAPSVPISEAAPLFRSEDTFAQLYHDAVLRVRLREDFTFETFAVSSSNEMAHAAAQAVAKSPGRAYNLLYIYGGVGVGKTHLTQAICHVMLKDHPDLSLIYCTGEEFTNEIIEAIRRKETHPFKKKYRSASALFIDDIQFIAGKATVQEEFFHTFNAIQREGGQVVLVSDQPPHAIDGLEDRLRSRFEGGLIIDIQQPNFELRTAILLIKARTLHVTLPIDAAKLISANVESARKLEGFLTRLVSEARLRNQPISEELVRGLLSNLNDREARLRPTARLTGTMGVEQKSPIFTPGVANVAVSTATARSQAATSWQPAANAWPCTRAITGCGMAWIVSIIRVQTSNTSR